MKLDDGPQLQPGETSLYWLLQKRKEHIPLDVRKMKHV